MLTYKAIDRGKKAVIFELDDVLYPEKDYLLQVYYLFANFLEYTETVPPAAELTDFLKKSLEQHGADHLFEKAAEVFGISAKYEENFKRLHVHAQLPLKLLIHEPLLQLMKDLRDDGKQSIILTKGNPLMQLNKLKHMEWHGLEKALKVYFHEELSMKNHRPLVFLLQDNGLQAKDVLYISTGYQDKESATEFGIDYVDVREFLK